VQWVERLPGFAEQWPVRCWAREKPPAASCTAFDSSLLEFRRLAPAVWQAGPSVNPDLFGFGFSPRLPRWPLFPQPGCLSPSDAMVGAAIARPRCQACGWVIGASMGGAVASELATAADQSGSRRLAVCWRRRGLTRPRPKHCQHPSRCSTKPRVLVFGPACRAAAVFLSPRLSRTRKPGVGAGEAEVASLHLRTPGWGRFRMRRFARSGVSTGCGSPLPAQRCRCFWGETNDRDSATAGL